LTQRSAASFRAVVQQDAVAALPPGIDADARAVSSGARRALESFRGMGTADLIHGLDVDLPVRPGAPTVATVHDLSVFDVPWAFSPVRARGEQALVTQALKRATRIIAVSEFTAGRIRERFGLDATVTHLAPQPGMERATEADVAAVRAKYKLPETCLLHVGTIEPRKNVAGVIAAARALDVPVALAGAQLEDVPGLDHRLVHQLGYVDAADLAALYCAATIVIYPSRYEGFGLPPIEAMACGAAVVATRVGALPEVLDPKTLLDPEDNDALVDTVRELLADDVARSAWARSGKDHVDQLSWTSTADKTLDVYRSLGLNL